jgi:hypothetical protein
MEHWGADDFSEGGVPEAHPGSMADGEGTEDPSHRSLGNDRFFSGFLPGQSGGGRGDWLLSSSFLPQSPPPALGGSLGNGRGRALRKEAPVEVSHFYSSDSDSPQS